MANDHRASPSALQLARGYLAAAVLFPPRGMKLGWQMPGQPLAVRVVLFVLPAVGPVIGTVMGMIVLVRYLSS